MLGLPAAKGGAIPMSGLVPSRAWGHLQARPQLSVLKALSPLHPSSHIGHHLPYH